MPRMLLLLTLVFIGCKGADDDGDNFSASVDCDDADPSTYPGAPELCDGLDNDCDGGVDDDPTDGLTLYADNDGDGYGNPTYMTRACGDVEGYVENSDDCDDVAATALPGGVEVCDGHDNDCNGTVDDGVQDAPIWYADDDGDGYGAEGSVPVQSCAAPTGYVDNDGDCDDTQETANPETIWYVDADGDGYGALAFPIVSCAQLPGTVENYDDCDDLSAEAYPGRPEICDMLDNDCDGYTDAADEDVADLILWYADGDGDGYGLAGTEVADCFAPSGYSALSDDCDDADDATFPGAEEACDGLDNDCDVRIDNGCPLLISGAPTLVTGTGTGDYLGYTVSISGDLDGDGTEDLVVGAYGDDGVDNASSGQGAAYVFYGPLAAGALDVANAGAILRGESGEDQLGYDIGKSVDFTGDGFADALVGAYGNDTTASYAGAAYVFAGPVSGEVSAADATFSIYGEDSTDYLAQYYFEGAGDLNADGATDLAVGAYGYDYASGISSSGAIYVFFGPDSGEALASDADIIFFGTNSSDYVGYPAAIGDDLNGDGVSDMAIGASGTSSGNGSNAVYLLYGPFGAGMIDATSADVTLSGDSGSRGTGSMLATGDVNNDGAIDLAIGAKYSNYGGSSSGAVYTVEGPFSGAYTLAADADFLTYEANSSVYLGGQYNTVALDDIDGDGAADLVVGSYNHSGQVSAGGGAFLFWGPMSGVSPVGDADREFLGVSTSEYAGNGLDIGDVDGDGVLDVAVSGRGYSAGAGRVGIWFGTGL